MCVLGKMSLCSDNSNPQSSAALAGHWEQAMPLADDIKQEP